MNRITKTIGIMSAVVAFVLLSVSPASADPIVTQGDFYKVVVTPTVTGDKKVAKITVTPGPKYHCNMQYPWKLTLKSGPGLPEQTIYKKADAKKFTEPDVTFEIPTGNSATQKVKAQLKMSLCDEKQCKSVKLDLTW